MPQNIDTGTEDDLISTLLSECKTIAVVGLSAKQERPSHGVARYLQAHGYRIIPVNPSYAGSRILNEHCYPTLTQARNDMVGSGVPIDIVDCFRKSQDIMPIVEEAIAIGARCIWMQLGIVNEEGAQKARSAGLEVVMDRCLKIEHMQRR